MFLVVLKVSILVIFYPSMKYTKEIEQCIKTNDLTGITNNINLMLIDKEEVTEELVNRLDTYYKEQMSNIEAMKELLFEAKKYREKQKLPLRGVFRQVINFK